MEFMEPPLINSKIILDNAILSLFHFYSNSVSGPRHSK